MQEYGQLDGVLSFWELSQPLVARVAEHLGLPGNPPDAVDAARDKHVSCFSLSWTTYLKLLIVDNVEGVNKGCKEQVVKNTFDKQIPLCRWTITQKKYRQEPECFFLHKCLLYEWKSCWKFIILNGMVSILLWILFDVEYEFPQSCFSVFNCFWQSGKHNLGCVEQLVSKIHLSLGVRSSHNCQHIGVSSSCRTASLHVILDNPQ